MAAKADTEKRRDWNWDDDGQLDGMYVETRQVTIRNGPSAGQTKLVFDFHVGLEDELVSVFETAVLRSKLIAELKARKRQRDESDFGAGERIIITPKGMREGPNGSYRDFEDIVFEHPAEKPSALDLLGSDGGGEDEDLSDFGRPDDDDFGF
jgi:hypothetical protein